jgi:hypothetical protein
MKRYLVMSIVAVLLVGPVIFLSDNLHCKQDDKAITVFYTHDLRGTLEPCG